MALNQFLLLHVHSIFMFYFSKFNRNSLFNAINVQKQRSLLGLAFCLSLCERFCSTQIFTPRTKIFKTNPFFSRLERQFRRLLLQQRPPQQHQSLQQREGRRALLRRIQTTIVRLRVTSQILRTATSTTTVNSFRTVTSNSRFTVETNCVSIQSSIYAHTHQIRSRENSIWKQICKIPFVLPCNKPIGCICAMKKYRWNLREKLNLILSNDSKFFNTIR